MTAVVLAGIDATEQAAAGLLPLLEPGAVVALSGHLGAGKTAFVQALARAAGVTEPVRSPTFTVAHRYVVPGTGEAFAHLDLYRSPGATVAKDLGDKVLFAPTDVTDADQVSAAIAAAVKRFGAVHIAVNCAGIGWAQRTAGRPAHDLRMFEMAAKHGFHFDTVQMPLNVMDAHFRSFAHLVLPYLVEHGIAALGMKSFADSVLLKSKAPIQPLEYLHYSLNLPTSVVITGIESQRDLDQAFEAVRAFQPMDKAAVAELLERSRPYAIEGKYELFKTSSTFDGTAKNAAWLGEDVEGVQELQPVME